jgi:hypothetical protein
LRDSALHALAHEGHASTGLVVDVVHDRPGAETSVGFIGSANGREVYVVATTAQVAPGPHVSVVSGPDGRAAVWAHPHDPSLPGLRIASDAAAVSERLARYGVDSAWAPEVVFVAYRPLRRAVVRFEAETPVFVKVLRLDRVDRVLAAARAIGDITPPVWDLGDGLLASPRAAGTPLATKLVADEVDPQQLFDSLERGLDRLGRGVTHLPARESWVDRRDTYAAHLRKLSPELTGMDALVASIDAGVASYPGPIVPTHGDLNPQNVWVQSTLPLEVTALIDVDTAGPGHRVDDHACLIAHVAAMDVLHGTGRFGELAMSYAHIASRAPFGDSVWARAAAVLLSLAASHDDAAVRSAWLKSALLLANRGQVSR